MQFSILLDDGRSLGVGEFEPLAGANVLVSYKWSDDRVLLIEFVNGLPMQVPGTSTDVDAPRLSFSGDFEAFAGFLRGTQTLWDVAERLIITSDDLAGLMVTSGIVQSPLRRGGLSSNIQVE